MMREKFITAVEELISYAGEDELLKRKIAKWVNNNFRQFNVEKRVSMVERKLPHIKEIMEFRINGMVSEMSAGLLSQGDAEQSITEDPATGDIILSLNMITFMSKDKNENSDSVND